MKKFKGNMSQKFKGFSSREFSFAGTKEWVPEDKQANSGVALAGQEATSSGNDAGDQKKAPPASIFYEEGSGVEALECNPRLKEGLLLQGFTKLTLVQHQSYDPIMADDSRDILIRSSTGSGKTIAYMFPLIQRILNFTEQTRITREHGAIAIVMVPTRELAEQCYAVLQKTLRKISFLVSGCITGGEQRKKEKARLRQGVHFLVATVGRLLDHLRTTESFNIRNLEYLIFDEADRLLDMGYEKDIITIKEMLTHRQIYPKKSILVSATLDENIRRVSHYVLRDPVVIGEPSKDEKEEGEEGDDDHEERFEAPPTLTQHYAPIPTKLRLATLFTLLRWKLSESTVEHKEPYLGRRDNYVLINQKKPAKPAKEGGVKIIVFMNSADGVEFHYRLASLLKIRSNDKHAYRSDKSTTKEEREERKKEAKKRKGDQKKKEREANAHLDHDDEDGFVDFDSQDSDEEGMVGRALRGKGLGEEFTEQAAALDDIGWDSFLNTNLFKLHANMSQLDRTSIYESFKHCDNGVLFATDVASRGLDMPGVRYVIQYDPALDLKAYTHRIGRTARAGKLGDSVLFVQPPHEEPYVDFLRRNTNWELKRMSPELILYHLSKVFKGHHLLEMASELHTYCEEVTSKEFELRRLSAIAFQAYARGYNAYKDEDLKEMFRLNNLHLGHVAKSFAIMKNPTKLHEVAKEKTGTGITSKSTAYEPAHVRKAKNMERFRDGGDGMTRDEKEAAAARKSFRKPKATSRVGQFDEFASGEALPGGDGPARKKRRTF